MAEDSDDGEGLIGLETSPDIRKSYLWRIRTQKYAPVTYSAVEGQAIVEGCIVLGTVAEMEELAANVENFPSGDLEEQGVAITGKRFRWPGAVVPYRIDPGLQRPERVTSAIAHWEAKTKLRFRKRVPSDANSVFFRAGNGCSSSVGMRGGEQFVTLGASCTTGNVIHEIGHAIGLWHEQSREDRDHFISIKFVNIEADALHNFNQHISDGDDLGAYDYGSIMHYPRNAFSKNGKPTIVTPHGQAIGQRTGLSPRDIAAVALLYP